MNSEIVTKDSWKRVPMSNKIEDLKLDIKLTKEELETLKKGYLPKDTSDRWFMYYENGKCYFHRSWTGFCIFIVDISEFGNITHAVVTRDTEIYKSFSIEEDIKTITDLIYLCIQNYNTPPLISGLHIFPKTVSQEVVDNTINEADKIAQKIQAMPDGTKSSINALLENKENVYLPNLQKMVINRLRLYDVRLDYSAYDGQTIDLPYKLEFIKRTISSNDKKANLKINYYNEEELVINNEYDYSNIIPTEDKIIKIVEFCDQMYNNYLHLIEEDEKQNEKLKYEYQNYNFKNCYGMELEIKINSKNYNNISCKGYKAFLEIVSNNQLKNIDSLEIKLNLDYKKGKNNNLKEHQNSFNITFKPYEITFIRKSNYNEDTMNRIERIINKLLKEFSIANTIFCSKD